MKHSELVTEKASTDYPVPSYEDLLLGLRDCQRDLGKLKDYNVALKIFLALLVLFMIFWFGVDVVLRLVKLF